MSGNYTELYASLVRHIREQRIIWHFCTPKSASTYLMKQLLQATSGNGEVMPIRCVPLHTNRPQVVCAYTVAESFGSFSKTRDKVMLGRHVHAAATNDLLDMISENHLVIVQTRSLMDTVVSAYDHLNRQPLLPMSAVTDAIWPTLSDCDKIDYLTHTYVPWHVQFVQSWDRASAGMNTKWVDYREVIDDTEAVVRDILKHFGVAPARISAAPLAKSNFNVGRVGRGEEVLSATQRSKISSLVAMRNNPWQGHSGHAAVAL